MIGRWIRISCRDAHVLLSEGRDGALAPLDRLRLRLHLAFCSWCSRISRQLQFLSDAVRRLDQ